MGARLLLLGMALALLASMSTGGCGDDEGADLDQSCAALCQAQEDGGCLFGDVATCTEFCVSFEAGSAACRNATDTLNRCRVSNDAACPPTADPCAAEQERFNDACGLTTD